MKGSSLYNYSIILPLPPSIQLRLASFCYGLPQVQWNEKENFHLTLFSFGSLTDLVVDHIREYLHHLFFLPFSILLQGLGHFHNKRNDGSIWVSAIPDPALLSLIKSLSQALRPLHLNLNKSPPLVLLGHYKHVNSHRLADYLNQYRDYSSEPIAIQSCLLMRSFQTSKHMIYECVDQYMASEPIDGKD